MLGIGVSEKQECFRQSGKPESVQKGHLGRAVILLRAKVLQDLGPKVRVPSPADIPQVGACLYEACVVPRCHQHLQPGTVWLTPHLLGGR